MTLQERLDAAEREREAFAERVFRHGFSDGWTANQKGRLAASASVDEAWHFYVADGALQKSVALTANHSAPVVEERNMDWQPIETAPKDGTIIYARRIYDGKLIAEGFAKWGINSPDAPMRQWSDGGKYGDIPPNNEYADTARWVTHEGRFSFPDPTHWKHGR